MKLVGLCLILIGLIGADMCHAQTALEIYPVWSNGSTPVKNITVSAPGLTVVHKFGNTFEVKVPADTTVLTLELLAPETDNEPAVACTILVPWAIPKNFVEAKMPIEIKSFGKLAGKSGSWRMVTHASGTF